jgi:hypothetical protein
MISNLSEFVSAQDIVLKTSGSSYLKVEYALPYREDLGGYYITELKAQQTITVPFTLKFLTHASPQPDICSQNCTTTGVEYRWFCEATGRLVQVPVSSGVTYCTVAQGTVQSSIMYGTIYVNCPGAVSSPCPEEGTYIDIDPDTCCPCEYGCKNNVITCTPTQTTVTQSIIQPTPAPPPIPPYPWSIGERSGICR